MLGAGALDPAATFAAGAGASAALLLPVGTGDNSRQASTPLDVNTTRAQAAMAACILRARVGAKLGNGRTELTTL